MRLAARPRVSPQGTAGPRGRSPGAMRGSLLFRCAGALCILLLSLRTDGETENKINDDCTIAWGDLEPDVEYKTVEFETSTSWISPLIEIARFYIDITLDEILPPGKQLSPFFPSLCPKEHIKYTSHGPPLFVFALCSFAKRPFSSRCVYLQGKAFLVKLPGRCVNIDISYLAFYLTIFSLALNLHELTYVNMIDMHASCLFISYCGVEGFKCFYCYQPSIIHTNIRICR